MKKAALMDIQRSAQHSNPIREGGERMVEGERVSKWDGERGRRARREGKESDTHFVRPESRAAFSLPYALMS